jgi:hypothetical protein
MPEVVIKYKNNRTLQVLQDIAKYFDFVVADLAKSDSSKKNNSLPVTYSKNPDVKALSGIWKNKEITLEELRKKAWGNRA